MLIHPWDAAGDGGALAFVRAQQFGTLIAAGRGRDVPVVVPTQFLLVRDVSRDVSDDVTVLLHLARPNPDDKLDVLRRQLDDLEPGSGVADPEAHRRLLKGIRGLRPAVRELRGTFKYGGSADAGHRLAVAGRLAGRDGPEDAAARRHLLRRTELR